MMRVSNTTIYFKLYVFQILERDLREVGGVQRRGRGGGPGQGEQQHVPAPGAQAEAPRGHNPSAVR